MGVYRPPSSSSNIDTFFAELTVSLSKPVNKFDNLIAMGDFNIDVKKKVCSGFDKLEELCDTFKGGLSGSDDRVVFKCFRVTFFLKIQTIHFRFRLIFNFNKKELQSCELVTY